jgi:hypothetical protein
MGKTQQEETIKNNREIFKGVIDKAVIGGFTWAGSFNKHERAAALDWSGCYYDSWWARQMIDGIFFNIGFVKAFFGRSWSKRIMEMAVVEDRIKFLEKYL